MVGASLKLVATIGHHLSTSCPVCTVSIVSNNFSPQCGVHSVQQQLTANYHLRRQSAISFSSCCFCGVRPSSHKTLNSVLKPFTTFLTNRVDNLSTLFFRLYVISLQ